MPRKSTSKKKKKKAKSSSARSSKAKGRTGKKTKKKSSAGKKKEEKKIFYKIGEVCTKTDTEPYVLRYWESEFPDLAPSKNRSGQRIYAQEDVDMVLRIKELLYEDKFTIAGARRKLEEEKAEGAVKPEAKRRNQEVERLRGCVRKVQEELREVLDLLS